MSQPRICIDARMVNEHPHGIAKYVMHLVQGLQRRNKIKPLAYEPIFFTSPHLSREGVHAFAPFKCHTLSAPFLNPTELFEIPRALRSLQAALYHSPSFASLWHCPCPHAVTLHDLNHLTYGDWSKKIYYQFVLKRFAKSASVLMTVSKFSRHEIATWLQIPETQIEIVYNAIEPLTHTQTPLPWDLLPQQYFFVLANDKSHKNTELLIRAYTAYCQNTINPWPLVLTLKDSQPVLTTGKILKIGRISEDLAQTLLKHAGALLSPSIYEGFGLPPVEAAAAGIKIAVSDIPPHREGLQPLSSKEVLWVQPEDQADWAKAFSALQRGEIQAPSTQHQQQLYARWSPDHLAEQMDQIYQKSISRGRERS